MIYSAGFVSKVFWRQELKTDLLEKMKKSERR